MENIKVSRYPAMENTYKLDKETILVMLQKMMIIRYTEATIAMGVLEKRITTPCHLYTGQEANAVGVCEILKESDYVFSTHRSHGHYLAKGGDLKALFAEVYCRETGCSGGRGGSMHLCDPGKGLLGSSSIVAGGLGIGLGPALKSKVMGGQHVSVIFHGDCVPEEGIWHESLNFAATMKLPVVYVCENNLYAASAGLEERRVNDNIHEVARTHGLPAMVIDGNDVFAVYAAAREAVQKARNGEGPQFIETRTYRWLGHVGPHDDIDKGLRSLDELLWWKDRCPIKSLRDWLLINDEATLDELDYLDVECKSLVEAAERYAISCFKPHPNTLYDHIYAI